MFVCPWTDFVGKTQWDYGYGLTRGPDHTCLTAQTCTTQSLPLVPRRHIRMKSVHSRCSMFISFPVSSTASGAAYIEALENNNPGVKGHQGTFAMSLIEVLARLPSTFMRCFETGVKHSAQEVKPMHLIDPLLVSGQGRCGPSSHTKFLVSFLWPAMGHWDRSSPLGTRGGISPESGHAAIHAASGLN